jgi:hypothetical protein
MIGYRIIDTQLNRIECGEHYELDIEDVAKFLGEE